MTAIAEHYSPAIAETADSTAQGALAARVTPQLVAQDGSRAVIRAAQRLAGVALVIAAIGLWMAPGAADPELWLMRLGLSVVAALFGTALVLAGRAVPAPEAEIDLIRREFRLMRWQKGRPQLVLRRRLCDLGAAEIDGDRVRLWLEDGLFLAEMRMTSPEVMKHLRRCFQDAKLIST